ncbi:MAG: hypothetical protein JWM41_196 [Gemmatimonadetes bacterium]|nr:hypothetical protein [Gemmatimonadota bacterium]
MYNASPAARFLEQEARGLVTRLARVKPFALLTPSVPAAAVTVAAQSAIESYLATGRQELRARVGSFLRWIRSPEGQHASAAELQRRFTFLRLRFNVVLSQFDIFAEVLTQRSEHETGVLVGGLDVVAAEALEVPGLTGAPPVICYLVRDPGAAIRRARTRLPGGGSNPVAVIRVPRERMIGSGIASSLVHEVGHQGAALLGLVESLRPVLQARQRTAGDSAVAWQLWERWISEIVADLWSAAKVGVAAPLGLIGVVSLPRAFVFRINAEDPHPAPWIRVKISCAMGNAMYPHPQWDRLAALWGQLYPLSDAGDVQQPLFKLLETTIPELVQIMLAHRPTSLGGRSLRDALRAGDRQPQQLAALFRSWNREPMKMREHPPTLVFAAIGQARADGILQAEEESRLLAYLLTYWALRSTLDIAEVCATTQPRMRARWKSAELPSAAVLAAV